MARIIAWPKLPEPIRRAIIAWKDLPEPARQALVSAAELALVILLGEAAATLAFLEILADSHLARTTKATNRQTLSHLHSAFLLAAGIHAC